MKERKRNPEKEREYSKRNYEKLKIRLANDPEFAEEYRKKKCEQQQKRIAKIKSDPVKAEIFKAKQRERNNKFKCLNPEKIRINEIRRQHRKKAKQRNEQIEKTNSIKTKRFKNSLLTPEQRKEEYKQLTNQWKTKKNTEFFEKYGFTYCAFCNAKDRYGFETIEEVINYRINNKLSVKTGLENIKKCEIIEPIIRNITPIQVTTKRKSYSKRINTMQRKEDAYRDLQLRIINLERVITIDEIRIPKINDLRNEFIQQYGAMPI